MEKLKDYLKDRNIAIVTHRSIMPCIPGDDLKKFLINNECSRLLYIKHPLLLLEESYNLASEGQFFKGARPLKNFQAHHFKLPEPVLYIKDFIYTILWFFATRQKYDLYFGMNNLNAFAGLLLKRLGRVKKVIYYTIDLYPQRFNNKLINLIYHNLDKFCVQFCDETWNVSPFLVEYRAKRGLVGKNYSRQFVVPIGIWFDEMQRVPWGKVKKTKTVYVGHLVSYMGVDLAVRSITLIKKSIPNIKLEIIGGGEQLEELKQLVRELSIGLNVNFLGWKDKKEAESLMSDGAIGLAPFNTLIIDEKIKNADPAKIKDYLALALPVIITNATINARAISKAKCGIIIDYTPRSLANAVVKLLSNEKLLKSYRKNALDYVSQFDWNKLFSKNISRILLNKND